MYWWGLFSVLAPSFSLQSHQQKYPQPTPNTRDNTVQNTMPLSYGELWIILWVNMVERIQISVSNLS